MNPRTRASTFRVHHSEFIATDAHMLTMASACALELAQGPGVVYHVWVFRQTKNTMRPLLGAKWVSEHMHNANRDGHPNNSQTDRRMRNPTSRSAPSDMSRANPPCSSKAKSSNACRCAWHAWTFGKMRSTFAGAFSSLGCDMILYMLAMYSPPTCANTHFTMSGTHLKVLFWYECHSSTGSDNSTIIFKRLPFARQE